MSAPSAATSTGACAVRWTPSTNTSAPRSCAAAAISGTGGPGAQQVRRARHRDDAGARRQLARHVRNRELGRARVELGPPHGGADRLRGVQPRADVGVVVEAGDDHLVARAPGRGQRAGQVEGQRGHAAAEDHPARVGAQQVAHGGPGRQHDRVRRTFRSRDGAAVGQGRRSACRPRPPPPRRAPATRRGRRSARSPRPVPGSVRGRRGRRTPCPQPRRRHRSRRGHRPGSTRQGSAGRGSGNRAPPPRLDPRPLAGPSGGVAGSGDAADRRPGQGEQRPRQRHDRQPRADPEGPRLGGPLRRVGHDAPGAVDPQRDRGSRRQRGRRRSPRRRARHRRRPSRPRGRASRGEGTRWSAAGAGGASASSTARTGLAAPARPRAAWWAACPTSTEPSTASSPSVVSSQATRSSTRSVRRRGSGGPPRRRIRTRRRLPRVARARSPDMYPESLRRRAALPSPGFSSPVRSRPAGSAGWRRRGRQP